MNPGICQQNPALEIMTPILAIEEIGSGNLFPRMKTSVKDKVKETGK
jgi:hypothetical protein